MGLAICPSVERRCRTSWTASGCLSIIEGRCEQRFSSFVSSMFMPCRLLASNRIYPALSVHRLQDSRHLTRLDRATFPKVNIAAALGTHSCCSAAQARLRERTTEHWPGWRGSRSLVPGFDFLLFGSLLLEIFHGEQDSEGGWIGSTTFHFWVTRSNPFNWSREILKVVH